MSLIPREYAYLAAILALAGSLWWFGFHERTVGAQKCESARLIQLATEAEQGRKAVEAAQTKVREEMEQEKAEQKAQADKQTAELQQKADDAHAKASALEARYQLQLKQDKSCAAWAAEKIPCDLE